MVIILLAEVDIVFKVHILRYFISIMHGRITLNGIILTMGVRDVDIQISSWFYGTHTHLIHIVVVIHN